MYNLAFPSHVLTMKKNRNFNTDFWKISSPTERVSRFRSHRKRRLQAVHVQMAGAESTTGVVAFGKANLQLYNCYDG